MSEKNNEVCEVCGGRLMTCNLIGHRSENDRHIQWLPPVDVIPQAPEVAVEPVKSYQQRVQGWMQECFGPLISSDTVERNHRFTEEALELVQACGCTADEVRRLVDYVFDRPIGVIAQEVGGVAVTLAALCSAYGIDMQYSAETELARILQPEMVEKIRAKQRRKPNFSPLPGVSYPERVEPPAVPVVEAEPVAQTIGSMTVYGSGPKKIKNVSLDPETLERGDYLLYTSPPNAADMGAEYANTNDVLQSAHDAMMHAIESAYGHLWHVNNEPGTPQPDYSPEKAAYAARRFLRDQLTHEQRGLAINRIGRELGFIDAAIEAQQAAK